MEASTPRPEDDQEDETEQSLFDLLQTPRQISRNHENMVGTHQVAHWYGCYVLVEPSADSFWLLSDLTCFS